MMVRRLWVIIFQRMHTIQIDFARSVADLHKEIARGERRGKARTRRVAA